MSDMKKHDHNHNVSHSAAHNNHSHNHHSHHNHGSNPNKVQNKASFGASGALPCDGEGHEHHHHNNGECCCHYHEMKHHKPDYFKLARICVSVAIMIAGHFLHEFEFYFMLAAAIISGYDIVFYAFKYIFKGKVFSEYFLMTIAAVAACVVGKSHEAAAVVVLFRIGEFFQECALRYSRKKIIENRPDSAHELEESGSSEAFISKFAKIYTPVVLCAAILIAIWGPIFGAYASLEESLYSALSLLVIACPCAIVISVPLAYSAGIAGGAKNGVFFANTSMLDSLAKTKPGEVFEMKVALNDKEGVLVSTQRHATIATAEAVVVNNKTANAAYARRIAKRTKQIALENILFVILVKLVVIVLAVYGISSLWFAVFADSGIAIITVLNSLRGFIIRKR